MASPERGIDLLLSAKAQCLLSDDGDGENASDYVDATLQLINSSRVLAQTADGRSTFFNQPASNSNGNNNSNAGIVTNPFAVLYDTLASTTSAVLASKLVAVASNLIVDDDGEDDASHRKMLLESQLMQVVTMSIGSNAPLHATTPAPPPTPPLSTTTTATTTPGTQVLLQLPPPSKQLDTAMLVMVSNLIAQSPPRGPIAIALADAGLVVALCRMVQTRTPPTAAMALRTLAKLLRIEVVQETLADTTSNNAATVLAEVLAESLAANTNDDAQPLLPAAAASVLSSIFVDGDHSDDGDGDDDDETNQDANANPNANALPVSRAWDRIATTGALTLVKQVVLNLQAYEHSGSSSGMTLSDLSVEAKEQLILGIRLVLQCGPPQLALVNAQRALAVAQATKQLAETGLEAEGKNKNPDAANDDGGENSVVYDQAMIERTLLPVAVTDNRARSDALAGINGLVDMLFDTVKDSATATVAAAIVSESITDSSNDITTTSTQQEITKASLPPRSSKYSQIAVSAACESIATMCQSSEELVQALIKDAKHDVIIQCIELRSNAIDLLIKETKATPTALDGDIRGKIMEHAQVRLHLLTILNLIGTSKEACATLLQHPRLVPLASQLLGTMGTFDYEGTRKMVGLVRNLALEPEHRHQLMGFNLGRALMKIVPSRDVNSGALASASMRLLTSGLEEVFVLDVVNPITAKMALSIDIKTTHPHIRVELARLLANTMCVAGERTRFEQSTNSTNSDSNATESGLASSSVVSVKLMEEPKDEDVVQILKLFSIVNSREGVKAVSFLLGATDEGLITSCLAGLRYCSADALKGLASTLVAPNTTAQDRMLQLQSNPTCQEVAKEIVTRMQSGEK